MTHKVLLPGCSTLERYIARLRPVWRLWRGSQAPPRRAPSCACRIRAAWPRWLPSCTCPEATAQDDALEVLEALLRELFGDAIKADKKARLRTLNDLDQAAATLAHACQMLLDTNLPDDELRATLFEKIPRDMLTQALEGVNALIRPADNVYYRELDTK